MTGHSRGDWCSVAEFAQGSAIGSAVVAVPSAAQLEKQRLITLGLMAVFAILAAQPKPFVPWRIGLRSLGSPTAIASRYNGFLAFSSVHAPHAPAELLKLGGIPIRRRQCRGCRQHRCLCLERPSFARAHRIGPRPIRHHHLRREKMFRRSAVHYGAMPQPVTPYQKAAQVWDERIGSARVQARNWRLIAFGCLFLFGGLSAALVSQSLQGTVTPWIVEVDHLGQAQTIAPAISFYQPTDPQIAFHLARFIEDVRSLPADAIVLRQNWLRAYDFTSDRGALALNDHARANDPFAKVGKLQVAIEVSSVIRASPESFRLSWVEQRYENGQSAGIEHWTAILTIAIQTPRDADRLRKNPLGIYVNAISWSKDFS